MPRKPNTQRPAIRRPSKPAVVGERAAARRHELNLTQMELAARLGWSQAKVSQMEKQRMDIQCMSLRELALGLNCSADWLLGLSKHRDLR